MSCASASTRERMGITQSIPLVVSNSVGSEHSYDEASGHPWHLVETGRQEAHELSIGSGSTVELPIGRARLRRQSEGSESQRSEESGPLLGGVPLSL